jgi:hypothetical protein
MQKINKPSCKIFKRRYNQKILKLSKGDQLKTNNFWCLKSKEKIILKILESCHRSNLKIENMNFNELIEALKSPIRNTSGI